MIMIVISFALVKFYAFAILYVLVVMQIKLVVVVVVYLSDPLMLQSHLDFSVQFADFPVEVTAVKRD